MLIRFEKLTLFHAARFVRDVIELKTISHTATTLNVDDIHL